jgi:hypothetical protein
LGRRKEGERFAFGFEDREQCRRVEREKGWWFGDDEAETEDWGKVSTILSENTRRTSMINRPGIHPPRRLLLPLDPFPWLVIHPRRLLVPTPVSRLLRLLLFHFTSAQKITPAPIITRQQITPNGLIHMQPFRRAFRAVEPATWLFVRARAFVVGKEFVYCVGGCEGEAGEGQGLPEEEAESGRAVDVEFCLGRGVSNVKRFGRQVWKTGGATTQICVGCLAQIQQT